MYKPRTKVVCTRYVQASLKHQNFWTHSQKEKDKETRNKATTAPCPPKPPNHTIIPFWVTARSCSRPLQSAPPCHDSVSGCTQKPWRPSLHRDDRGLGTGGKAFLLVSVSVTWLIRDPEARHRHVLWCPSPRSMFSWTANQLAVHLFSPPHVFYPRCI